MAAIAEYRKKVKHVALLTFSDLIGGLSVIAFICLLGLDNVWLLLLRCIILIFLLLVKRLFCW